MFPRSDGSASLLWISGIAVVACVVLFVVVFAGSHLMMMYYNFMVFTPEVRQAMAVCGSEAKQDLLQSFDLDLGKSGGKIKDEIKRIDNSLPFSGVAEKDKLSAYREYLACIDRRAPVSQSKCTPTLPCVDIVRVADFTASHCDGPNARHDVAKFTDHYTLTPPQPVYRATALPQQSGATLPEVKFYALHGAQRVEVPVNPQACPQCGSQQRTYNIDTENGQADGLWVWTNGHQERDSGIAIRSRYLISSIQVSVQLPEGVELLSPTIDPPELAQKCVFSGNNSVRCSDLYTTDQIKYGWQWTLWDRCPLPIANATK